MIIYTRIRVGRGMPGVALLLGMGLLAGSLFAGEVTYEDLLNPPPENWLTYGRSYDSQRHSPLDQITKENVRQLAPAWIFPMPGSRQLESVPIVVDGVMYVSQPNEVYALDARAGRQIWSWRREAARQRGGASVIHCCCLALISF